MFINQYMIIKDVGKGAYGTVKLVYNTQDDLLYAMKVGTNLICVLLTRALKHAVFL